MYDTTLTMSPDLTTMTGVGGFPPNPQTVVRIGPPPKSPQGFLVDKILSGRRQTNAGLDDAPAPTSSKPPASNRRPQAEAAAVPPQVDQNIKDGDVFMRLGRKAVRNNSIRSLREAANHFRGAAEFYAAASDPDRQREAVKAADLADAEADRQAEARKPTKKTRRNAADCARMTEHIKTVKARTSGIPDANVAELEQLAMLKGCATE
ncbi:hypothetical protein [Methylobacterium radiotolerans]